MFALFDDVESASPLSAEASATGAVAGAMGEAGAGVASVSGDAEGAGSASSGEFDDALAARFRESLSVSGIELVRISSWGLPRPCLLRLLPADSAAADRLAWASDLSHGSSGTDADFIEV